MIKKFICSLAIFLLLPLSVSAEARNIYIGDIISLEIESKSFSADELRSKFQDFEIVEIKEQSGGYSLSLRAFIPGEYKITLGNKEIIINVQSTLEDINREDIFEGDNRVIEPGFSFRWNIAFYIFAGIFALSGGYILIKLFIAKKPKQKDLLGLFLQRAALLSAEDKNYLVDLTYYFKNYLEAVYKFKIIGKTTSEITKELKNIQGLENMLFDIHKWLTECDRLKFTGVKAQTEEKQEHCQKLIELVEKIDAQKEGTE